MRGRKNEDFRRSHLESYLRRMGDYRSVRCAGLLQGTKEM